MKFLGEGDKIVDCTKAENLSQRIFEFCTKKEDYFLNMFLHWDRVIGDVYRVTIGKHTFDIGSGLYVFIGCDDGDGDWAIIDEIIGRDIQVFNITPNMAKWSHDETELNQIIRDVEYYYPSSRNPIPLVSNDGERTIMVSLIDQYRNRRDRDFYSMFIL